MAVRTKPTVADVDPHNLLLLRRDDPLRFVGVKYVVGSLNDACLARVTSPR